MSEISQFPNKFPYIVYSSKYKDYILVVGIKTIHIQTWLTNQYIEGYPLGDYEQSPLLGTYSIRHLQMI